MYAIIGKVVYLLILFMAQEVVYAGQKLPVAVRSTKKQEAQEKEHLEKTLFIELLAMPDSVYVGQRVPYTLYVSYDPQSIQLNQVIPPEIINAESEIGKEPLKERSYRDGKSYETLTWQGFFYPKETGSVKIRGAKVAYVRLANDAKTSNRSVRYNLFGFFSATHVQELYAAEKLCTVLPLPRYATAVTLIGELSALDLSIDIPINRPMAHGEACIGRLTLYGQSNAARLTHEDFLPTASLPAGVKLYPAKKYPTADGFVFEYTLQAIQEGSWTIPPCSVTYFDPLLKRYRVLRTQSHAIVVQPGDRAQIVYDEVYQEQLHDKKTPLQTSTLVPYAQRLNTVVQKLALPSWLVWVIAALLLGSIGLQLCWYYVYCYGSLAQKIVARRWTFFILRRTLGQDLKPTQIVSTYILFQKLQHTINWEKVLLENPELYKSWLQCWQEILRVRFDQESSAVQQQFYTDSANVFAGLERGSWFL